MKTSSFLSIDSNKVFFVVCFLSTAVLFYSPKLYLDWDEWYMLDHLMKNGIAGIFHSHNEHFLPVFFGFYYLEVLAFGTWYPGYLIISYLIHSANGVLLRTFLSQLFPEVSRKALSCFAFLWVVSSLHSEVLQWAFTQAVSLSSIFIFLSFIYAARFLNEGNKKDGVFSVVTGAIAPLCFGNGFIILGYLFFLALLWVAQQRINVQQGLKRASSLLSALTLSLLVVAGSYWIFRHGAGHGIESGNSDLHLIGVINYLFVAWSLATILRGLGFYPEISLKFDPSFLPSDYLSTFTSLELAVAYTLGALLMLFATFFFLKRKYFNLFLFGNLIIVLSYLLPAIRRYHLGLVQSLSLRYSYISLVGLAIIFLALSIRTSELLKNRQLLLKFTALFCFVGYFAIHFYMGSNYDYFHKRGVANERFVTSLIKWQEKLCKRGTSMSVSYEAANTPLAGKHPVMPPSFTPGRHPIEIYQVLLWLDPSRYDLNCKKSN